MLQKRKENSILFNVQALKIQICPASLTIETQVGVQWKPPAPVARAWPENSLLCTGEGGLGGRLD